MNIGDKVKLKDIPENDRKYLNPFKGIAGTIINIDNSSPPKFLRVSFDESSYEDMMTWRVALI